MQYDSKEKKKRKKEKKVARKSIYFFSWEYYYKITLKYSKMHTKLEAVYYEFRMNDKYR